MVLANFPYFVTLVLRGTEGDVGIYQGVMIIFIALTGPVWLWLNKKYSQRALLNASMLMLAIIFAFGFAIGMDGLPATTLAYIFVAFVGMALGGYLILIYAMMGNLVDYDEILTKRRREAIFYGTFSFAIGLGTAVGTLILPLLLENFGYTQANPFGVRLSFPVMAVFVFIGWFIFRSYRIGDTPEETRKNLNLEAGGMTLSALSAGVARRVISPPKGIFLIGYGDRSKGNTGVHDDLTATALVLESGSTRVALVALDILTINEFIVDRIRARLAPTEVILCCSHTHSGPIAYADEKSSRKNREYIHSLVENIVAAIEEAQATLQPARLEYSHGEASVGINRREMMPDGHMEIGRNPSGARDSSVQVVSVFALTPDSSPTGRGDGVRVATVVNYACHGTVLGPANLLVSADWIGQMRPRVESELGGLSLFLQGAAANINPDMHWEDGRGFEKAAEQGHAVAEAVLAAVRTGSEALKNAPLEIARAETWLPTETRVETSRPPKNYGKPLLSLAKMPGFMAIFADLLLNQRYPWKSVIEARDGFWSVPMRINSVRIGDLALVTFAAETFTEIGMKVKAASPADAYPDCQCERRLHQLPAHRRVAPRGRLRSGHRAAGVSLSRPAAGTLRVHRPGSR